jgi:VanZ family protein
VVARGLRLWAPVVVWAALIFTLSSFHSLPHPPRVSDKHAHVGFYAVLSALLVRALAGAAWSGITTRVALAAFALATLYGVSDELHQRFVPGREASAADLFADSVGAAMAAGALRAWAIIRPRS